MFALFYTDFFQCSVMCHVRKELNNLKLLLFCTFSFDDEQDFVCDSSGLEENSIICSETGVIQNTALYMGTGNKYLILYILTILCEV